MGGIYLFNSFISNFYKIYMQRNFVEYKYGALISFIGLIISWVIAFFYNKYYTQKMLADGYYPEENDEYSIALLKEFTYIPYTNWLIIGAIILIFYGIEYLKFYNF